jgi:hypothetical protein
MGCAKRTNLPHCSSRMTVLMPAVHRVDLSGEICYESSHRIQVSGSEGVESWVCVCVMNVQSSPCGVLKSLRKFPDQCNSIGDDDDNAGVLGGKDCGISLSISIMLAVVDGIEGRC